MAESNMSISVNGHSQVPPGFRFHPTEEELLQYYLKKKVSNLRIDLDVICDIDLNKLEPWDIQEKCRIGTTPQNDWYFFSHKDKKYPTGTRTNRATVAGFWKATGRDKAIFSCSKRIGMRKTLVFYEGRAPHGRKSDWIMHEYRIDQNISQTNQYSNAMTESSTQEEGWVVCRIFKKKSHCKTRDDDHGSSPDMISPAETKTNGESVPASEFEDHEGTLEQIFQCMRSRKCCKEETNTNTITEDRRTFLKLPRLENNFVTNHNNHDYQAEMMMVNSWTALDRLVASQMNGREDEIMSEVPHVALRASSSSSTLNNLINPSNNGTIYYSNEDELWGFARSSSSYSSSDPISQFSNCHL